MTTHMLTIEQEVIRAAATVAAKQYGYTELPDGTLEAPRGKFESEPYYALYFYDAVMDGCADEPLYDGDTVAADLLPVSDDERAAFELDPTTQFVALWYSDSGFVTLDELTCEQYDELRAAYSDDDSEVQP